jgi:hypothetical protein
MTPVADITGLNPHERRRARWRGRSGRSYLMAGENLERFAMSDGALYLIAKGSLVLWVGSTGDLVADPMSRTRFRLALDCADRVFRVEEPEGEDARMATVWDLEGAEPAMELSAA